MMSALRKSKTEAIIAIGKNNANRLNTLTPNGNKRIIKISAENATKTLKLPQEHRYYEK